MNNHISDNKKVSHDPTSQSNQNKHDSTTGVHPSRSHGVGIWGNPRVTMTIRVDEELKKQFVPFAKRVFNSVCLPIESLMAGLLNTVVEAERQGVYPSATIPLKLDVEKIVIERNLRARRKLEFEGDFEDLCFYCLEDGMKTESCGLFRYKRTGEVHPLCQFHYGQLVSGRGSAWELANDE